MLISTPEYAHGLPGSLKNALDWLVSWPAMIGKPVGLIYGSTGEASYAQDQLKEILKTMSALVVPEATIAVQAVRSKIGNDGTVSEPKVILQIESMLRVLEEQVFRRRGL
jgi:NAD(P)H-dependent FMN reductase